MRLAALLLSAVLLAPSEVQAMSTPYDREWSVSPEVFIDEVLFGIPKGQGRRRGWKQARNQVLAAYAPMGLDVQVLARQRQPRASDTVTVPGAAEPIHYESLEGVPPGQIIAHLTNPGVSYADVRDGQAPNAGILGLSQLSPKAGQKKYRRSYRKLLSHELGHVLGLDHTLDTTSVMNPWGGQLPSSGDLAALAGPEVGLPDPGDPGYRPPSGRRRRHR